MTILPDRAYRRVKAKRVIEDRRELVRAFVDKFGKKDGLLRLSALTGHPPETYRGLAVPVKQRKPRAARGTAKSKSA